MKVQKVQDLVVGQVFKTLSREYVVDEVCWMPPARVWVRGHDVELRRNDRDSVFIYWGDDEVLVED